MKQTCKEKLTNALIEVQTISGKANYWKYKYTDLTYWTCVSVGLNIILLLTFLK